MRASYEHYTHSQSLQDVIQQVKIMEIFYVQYVHIDIFNDKLRFLHGDG